MSKMQKRTKRAKAWFCVERPAELLSEHSSKQSAENCVLGEDNLRIARMVELREGEVVVDVERLVEAFIAGDVWGCLAGKGPDVLRAALRKVGVR